MCAVSAARSRWLAAPATAGQAGSEGSHARVWRRCRHLERKVDADPIVGVCYRQSAMLQPVPDYVCRTLECLWVEDLQLNIDLWAYPLRVLPGPSEFSNRQCPIPHGGQRPVPEGQRPHISFVVTAHNNALATAQCLLELFRTAHEVPSAEYIVVDDGSTEDMAVLAEVGYCIGALGQGQGGLLPPQPCVPLGRVSCLQPA